MTEFVRMTESAAPKPKFTRRGVILGAAGLGLVLAVALVCFGVFGGNSTASVKVKFVGFEMSGGKNSFLAVFYLTNETAIDFELYDTDMDNTVLGRFHLQTGNSESWLTLDSTAGRLAFESSNLKSHTARTVKLALPSDGRTGRVEVSLVTVRLVPPGPLGLFREWARDHLPLHKQTPQAVCDQVIQCPLVLPDGTVQPPRLMSGSERKR
jgi:hypothetical protein